MTRCVKYLGDLGLWHVNDGWLVVYSPDPYSIVGS